MHLVLTFCRYSDERNIGYSLILKVIFKLRGLEINKAFFEVCSSGSS